MLNLLLKLYFVDPDLMAAEQSYSLQFALEAPLYSRYELKAELTDERRMASSGVLRRVALVRTDVSEELSACIIRVKESVI
jgi:hypothetical protein